MLHESTVVTSVDMEPLQPISRTYQYRKVMKPMLERKRRARINRCLDELKELMVGALAAEGENVSKLEKADILELTVRHLHRLRRTQRLTASPDHADRFRAGFTHCAAEVSRCLAATPGVDVRLGTTLMTHLGHRLNELDAPGALSPLTVQVPAGSGPAVPSFAAFTPPGSPASSASSAGSSPSPSPSLTALPGLLKVADEGRVSAGGEGRVWRPW
ncbi:enhancer of split mbeta protein-like [Ischnura elegans]|uniref:enhancer of split mbeta protein-like n=1 Tax=Ischnura elegans TaxID=197161 RepID=UPI001ED8BBD2|nr:enhancer of split mbeta protein-like [Ischnura elegans]